MQILSPTERKSHYQSYLFWSSHEIERAYYLYSFLSLKIDTIMWQLREYRVPFLIFVFFSFVFVRSVLDRILGNMLERICLIILVKRPHLSLGSITNTSVTILLQQPIKNSERQKLRDTSFILTFKINSARTHSWFIVSGWVYRH